MQAALLTDAPKGGLQRLGVERAVSFGGLSLWDGIWHQAATFGAFADVEEAHAQGSLSTAQSSWSLSASKVTMKNTGYVYVDPVNYTGSKPAVETSDGSVAAGYAYYSSDTGRLSATEGQNST